MVRWVGQTFTIAAEPYIFTFPEFDLLSVVAFNTLFGLWRQGIRRLSREHKGARSTFEASTFKRAVRNDDDSAQPVLIQPEIRELRQAIVRILRY